MRIVLPALLLGVLMVALGWLVTHLLVHYWPIDTEDTVDHTLAAHRDAILNSATSVLSTIADTPATVAFAAVALLVARWLSHHWRASLFIAVALAVEVSVFLLTTLVVHRTRPAFELDHSPPTSSFPSGHTAASIALYGAVAWLLTRRTGRPYAWLLLLMPLAVGFARLYRGMHHPSDVLAGMLLGLCAIVIAHRAVLDPSPGRARDTGRAPGRTALARRRTPTSLAGGDR